MSAQEVVQDLSFPVKVYVGIVHLLLFFLVVLFLQRPRKNGEKGAQQGRKSRTLTKDDRAVTIESCEWINSTLAWFYLHAQSNEDKDRTPHIVKLWLRALNKQLLKDKKKDQRIVIESLSPGCLPPKLTSVYCLCVSGNMQCITFHVESSDLGFLVRVLRQTDDGPKTTHLETRVVKLTGEVALKLRTAPSKLEVSVQFIGVPEIAMATKCLAKDSEVDGAEVQEKVKEVICKTITNIPLTADAASRERLSSDAGSATSKERLDSPSSISCVGEEGKLLVKVIKASGLCGKDKSGPISPYCIVSTSYPLQRKRTSMVRDNDSPFWNEYFTFDITPKTKEISLDIYDYEKTKKDDYLGQVIVPLSTVNRDQTCRLILPVLPKSSKSEHSKGDVSLEFTFDKDGKVIDATLPIVSGFERNVLPNDTEKPSAQSTPSEESPSVFMNGVGSGALNGHIPVRKRYIESSLDELAMEIEDYEKGGERPTPDAYYNGTQREEDGPELHTEPESPPVLIATEEAVVAAEEAGPSGETEHKEDDSEMAIVELLKLSGEEIPEESKEEKKEKEETEDETRETQDKGEIEEKEEKEQKEKEEEEQKEKDDEEQVAKEHEEQTEQPSLKPKHRRSFNFRFKKKKTDKKAEKEEEKVEERHEPEEGTQEDGKKEETPVEDKEEIKGSQEEEVQEAKQDEENEAKEEEAEKIEHAAELEPKPKLRRSFFKKRPKSMAAADKKTDEDSEERVLSRHDPVRHSYHAGDRPALEPSNLRKSTSQSSLLSYSPNPYSTLVYETISKGKKKYTHIPPVMAKRGAYEKGGNKLHIYNDHIFQAVHFTGSLPECVVCGKSIKGKVGKQGYQCRGCKMVTHRDCHYETTEMCTSDDVKQMDIEYVGDSEV